MTYRSTRGKAPELGFADVLLAGLATDGGLYVPTEIPELGEGITDELSYSEIAIAVMWPFVEGSIGRADFVAMVTDTYRGFSDPAVAPVFDLGHNQWLCDLSFGPTLAFKDFALQLLGRLLDYELTKRDERVTVIGATSGDTGSAAIHALANRERVEVVILHPEGRVSEIQRRQMTTVDAPNITNLAVAGNFDDCQDLVKEAFGDADLRVGARLAAVNSINWARVMAQTAYYVSAARRVSPSGAAVSFSVPTGNFGNVLAGWYAKHMGLPIDQLIVASNRNDVLTRVLESGALVAESVVPSLSPSMDIQISSNFERLLFEASGGDGDAVTELLSTFRATGTVQVPDAWMDRIREEFDGGRLDDDGTLAEMRRVHSELGILVDPHTAVALHVGRNRRRDPDVPLIVLGTAHPAKFGAAVAEATGVTPEVPDRAGDLMNLPERFHSVPNDLGAIRPYLPLQSGSGEKHA
ncbi:MAG: threonine synthase [Acidimicrobiales bacterium]|nr:threonine synthase [Acidimicrobiales bacterium]